MRLPRLRILLRFTNGKIASGRFRDSKKMEMKKISILLALCLPVLFVGCNSDGVDEVVEEGKKITTIMIGSGTRHQPMLQPRR